MTPISLVGFQDWYLKKCDGAWEHSNYFLIESLDNPGWKIKISGEQQRTEVSLKINRSDENWIHVKATSGDFVGYGGGTNLMELLEAAATWLGIEE